MTLKFRIGNKPGRGEISGGEKKTFFFVNICAQRLPRILGTKQQASNNCIAYRISGTAKQMR